LLIKHKGEREMNILGKFSNGVKKFFGVAGKEQPKQPIKLIPVEENAGKFSPGWSSKVPFTFSRRVWRLRKTRLAMQKESRKKNR
jgi:hypothetical protein